MARYFPGQRVRIVRNLFPVKHSYVDRLTGTEQVVASVQRDPPNERHPEFTISLRGVPFIWFSHDELEPILPEGMQPVSWSECLWQPEGEKV